MKSGKVCIAVLLMSMFFAIASAEEYTANIVCEKEIPVVMEGPVLYVTEDDYSAEEDILFTVEWYPVQPEEEETPCQEDPAATADMVITDGGILYCAPESKVSPGLFDILRSETEAEDTEHLWQPDEAILDAADCLHPGIILERCTDCTAIKLSMEKGGHQVVIDKAVTPTSQHGGLTQGMHCAICGRILAEQTALPAVTDSNSASQKRTIGLGGSGNSLCDEIGHDFVDGYCVRCWDPCPHADINVLITTSSTHHFVCNDCGERVVESHTVEHGLCTVCGYNCGECKHSRSKIVYTVPGSHYLECKDCGSRRLEPHTSGTCTCDVCGYEIKPHTVVKDAAVAPTCTAAGLTEGSHCSVCRAVLARQNTIPALGHTVVTDAASEATCTATGRTEGSHCSVSEQF